MNIVRLYLLLLKATATSFAGLASLPVIRDELVVRHHLLTDHQLNASVVITRSTPGPVGVYVVSVGYFAAGLPGAIAGWLAMATPSLAIVVLLRFFADRAEHPRIKGMLEAVVIASSALLLSSAAPLARDALVDPVTITIAVVATIALVWRKIDTLWVIGAAAAVTLILSLMRLSVS
jgi:chromate transporter